jgi:amyloid beta precursor protein binding protein 1
MKAQSADYIALQNVYRSKSQKDIAAVLSTVREVEKKLQRSKPIDAKEIEAFCKGAAWVKLIRGRALKIPDRVGHIDWADREKMVIRELQDESSLMALNVALLALDATIENLNVKSSSPKVLLAACHNESFKGDFTARAIGISNPLLADAEQEDAESVRERLTKLCAEIVRTGPVEMHNIASLAGGMVAQEVIKAVTKQYVPVDNTCIFDGIASKAGVFKL